MSETVNIGIETPAISNEFIHVYIPESGFYALGKAYDIEMSRYSITYGSLSEQKEHESRLLLLFTQLLGVKVYELMGWSLSSHAITPTKSRYMEYLLRKEKYTVSLCDGYYLAWGVAGNGSELVGSIKRYVGARYWVWCDDISSIDSSALRAFLENSGHLQGALSNRSIMSIWDNVSAIGYEVYSDDIRPGFVVALHHELDQSQLIRSIDRSVQIYRGKTAGNAWRLVQET